VFECERYQAYMFSFQTEIRSHGIYYACSERSRAIQEVFW